MKHCDNINSFFSYLLIQSTISISFHSFDSRPCTTLWKAICQSCILDTPMYSSNAPSVNNHKQHIATAIYQSLCICTQINILLGKSPVNEICDNYVYYKRILLFQLCRIYPHFVAKLIKTPVFCFWQTFTYLYLPTLFTITFCDSSKTQHNEKPII